jgi:hypothetical protein
MFLWQESPADCGGPGRRHRADLKLRFSMFGKLCMDTMDTMDMVCFYKEIILHAYRLSIKNQMFSSSRHISRTKSIAEKRQQ